MRKQYLKVVSLVMVGMLATGMLLDFNVGKASDTEGGGTPQTVTESGTASQDAGATQEGGEGTTTEPVVEATEEEKNPVWIAEDFILEEVKETTNMGITFDGIAIDKFSASGLQKYISLQDKIEVFRIPETLNGKKVERINGQAFAAWTYSKINEPDKFKIRGKVVLPSTMKEIEQYAFEKNEITEVNIPISIRYVSLGSFRYNKSLSKVIFEKGRKTKDLFLSGSCFSGCGITELDLPEHLSYISDNAFSNNKITKLVLPKTGLNALRYSAFYNNPIVEIENLRLKENQYNYDEISSWVFEKTQLKNISFKNFYPDETDEEVIDTESGLPMVKAAKKVDIDKGAFADSKLKSIEISDNIKLPSESNYYMDYGTGMDDDRVFSGNPGWIKGDERVALYRVDRHGKYVLEKPEIETSSSGWGTDDGLFNYDDYKTYVVNPVHVVVNLVDQDGKKIELKEGESFDLLNIKNYRGNEVEEYVEEGLTTLGNKKDFKIGDKFTFEAPKFRDFDFVGVEGAAEDKKEEADASVAVSLAENKGTGKIFSVELKPEKLDTISYGDGYKVGYKEYVFTLKYKKPVNSANVLNPELQEEPKQEPKEEPKTDPTPQPPVEPASTVNENIIPPLVEIIESSEEEEPEINLVPVVTEPVAVSDIEEISFDEDLTPRSDADLEEAGLDILGDEVPQGRKDFTNGKRNKDMKGLLAKTGGLHTVFYQLAAGLGLILLASILVELYRKRKLSK